MAAITVLLPVLNGMPYLRETLASLEAQTLRDFEVMLWDNGSTDGTVEEAKSWIPARLPGRVVVGRPLPLHLCLAKMVEEAATPFCARMDADDLCLPHRFKEQLHFLEQNPDVALVGCQIEQIDSQGKPMPNERWARFMTTHCDIVTQLMLNTPFCHPCVMYRTEVVRRAGNYAVPAPVEDLELYLRLVQTAQVANLSEVGLRYRRHPQSICAVAHEENRLFQAMTEIRMTHSQSLFGLAPETYRSLRYKEYPVSVVPMVRSALHRCAGNLAGAMRLMRSPEFLYAARCFTGPRDILSRIVYRLFEAIGPARSTEVAA